MLTSTFSMYRRCKPLTHVATNVVIVFNADLLFLDVLCTLLLELIHNVLHKIIGYLNSQIGYVNRVEPAYVLQVQLVA